MQPRYPLLCILSLALLAFPIAPTPAQQVLGPQDDALVLPRGVVRFRLLNQWVNFNERYGENTPGRPDGALEPLAIDFNLDTVGTQTFRNLAPLEVGLRSLTGLPAYTLSLGRTVVTADVTLNVTPFVIEAGLTDRLSVGVVVPYVRTRNDIFFAVNPDGREGNVGFNPALFGSPGAISNNQQVQTEFATAAQRLVTAYPECFPGGTPDPTGGPACPNVIALYTGSLMFAGGLAQIYGVGTAQLPGSPFVPITGTEAQFAIAARIASFNSLYQQFLADANPILTAVPTAAPGQLTVGDAQTILTNPAFGIDAAPLETARLSGIGDIEIGAKFLLYDSFTQRGADRLSPTGLNYRASVGTLLRLPTGKGDSPNNFVDVGTGHGQTDIELRGFVDVLYGSRFWTSFIGRYAWQLSDKQFVRIHDSPDQTLTSAYRLQKVERNLGDFLELEVNPRFAVNPYIGVMGHYYYRNKQQDRYEGTFPIPASVTGYADIVLDASTMNLETAQTEHRMGFGASFSTVKAFSEGRARLPLEVTYFHFQTTLGSGNAPKLFSDQVQLRIYTRLFGG